MLIGTILALATFVVLLISPDSAPDESIDAAFAFGVMITIPLTGYVVGLLLLLDRSARRIGFGVPISSMAPP